MAYIQSLGTGGTDKIRLNLSGSATAHTKGYSTTTQVTANVRGQGTYTIRNIFISKISCISNSYMRLTYYNNTQGESVTVTLSQGQTIAIDNSNGVEFSWDRSGSWTEYGVDDDAVITRNADITIDIYF